MSTALLSRSAAHDRAFERLYRRHVHEVYRYVLAVLRNQADAEDVTQATFLNAYRAFTRGEEPLKPRNWLLKIAHNECRQRFRAASRRPKEVEWDDRTPAPGADETVPSADEIRTALGQLSFNQRSALVMRELEGRSYGEIAQILDLSVSAVETLLFRARRALREQLEGALTCGEAEATLSKRLDGRLSPTEQRALRAHLRECAECATLERKQRARRAAVKRLGIVQLPPSLAGFLGGTGSITGGVVAGSGIVAKAAAVVAAGVVAGGVGHQAVEAVAADRPPRTPLPELGARLPTAYPSFGGVSAPGQREAQDATLIADEVPRTTADRVQAGVRRTLQPSARDEGADEAAAAPTADTAPAEPASGGSTAPTPSAPPQPAQRPVDVAESVARNLPTPPVSPQQTPAAAGSAPALPSVPSVPVDPPQVSVPLPPPPLPPPPSLP